MKKNTFQTGVRRLSPNKLKSHVDEWLTADAKRKLHHLYKAMIGVPTGAGLDVRRLTELMEKGGAIHDDSKYALCTVLGVTWEELSDARH